MEKTAIAPVKEWFDSLPEEHKRHHLTTFQRKHIPFDGDLRTKVNGYLNSNTALTFEAIAQLLGRDAEKFNEYLVVLSAIVH